MAKKTQLHELIPIEVTRGKESKSVYEHVVNAMNDSKLIEGFRRRYEQRAEDGTEFPAENKAVQISFAQLFNSFIAREQAYINVVATKDKANSIACADVIIGDKVLLTDMSAVTLIFLEKRIDNIIAMIQRAPVLDPAYEWTKSGDIHISNEVRTIREVKRPMHYVVFEPSEHCKNGQYEVINENVPVGEWVKTVVSGAMTYNDQLEMYNRLITLKEAIVTARQRANTQEVEQQKIADYLFNFIKTGQV